MRYYGCKNKLLKHIEDVACKTELYDGAKFVDLFTGTTTVAQHFKKLGYTVIANDNLEFCYALAKTYIELNDVPKFLHLRKTIGANKENTYKEVIKHLNNLEPVESFIYNHYCPTKTKGLRKYFSDNNGKKIDAIRTKIQEWKDNKLIDEFEYYYLITSLLEAINLVSNVAGTYAACLKKWDSRALKAIRLNPPQIIHSDKRNKAFKRDADELIKEINCDILYLDPPYNTRQYVSNYFILELIAEGWFNRDLEVKGIAGLIVDEDKKSKYSQKTTALASFSDLVKNAKARYILLSYNNEGILKESQINNILTSKGEIVSNGSYFHKRYRSINQTDMDPRTVNEMLFLIKTNGIKDRFNNLNGKKWLQHSFSIWRDIKKNREETKLKHPAMFPISLVERVIDIYTKKQGLLIFDPFVGSGSTIIGALKKKMKVVGIDLSQEYMEMIKRRLKTDYSDINIKNKYKLIRDDANNLDRYIKPASVDLCVTSPPYWDILNSRRSADNKERVNYGNSIKDLGNIDDYSRFINSLGLVFKKTYKVIKKGGFCVVVVMDLRKKSTFYPFHIDIVNMMLKQNFILRDIIMWDRQAEYNNMKPLGYPYSFIVNKVHEYILVFEK